MTILPANYGVKSVTMLLRVLYWSECNPLLRDRIVPSVAIKKDGFFLEPYKGASLEYCYGHLGKKHLWARKVKNLWCEESKKDWAENILHWTEFPKYKLNPKYGEAGDPSQPDFLFQVSAEREESYSYSIREDVETERRRNEMERAERQGAFDAGE